MDQENNKIRIAFMNIRGQTGLELSKQFQIENFVKVHNIDILNCQEINVEKETFKQCHYLTSSYEIISNNASNKYETTYYEGKRNKQTKIR